MTSSIKDRRPEPASTVPHPSATAATSRPGWPEIAVAVAVAGTLYSIGILLSLQIPPEQAIARGLAFYAVSGLAPLGGFDAAVLLRIRDVRAFGVRRVSWK